MAAISAHKKELDDLEKSAETIRRDFDQFFAGSQKRPPTAAQAQLAGVMRKIKEEELKEWNTQDRFRFNQIHARFVSMERMWARTLKQIEDGTYKRDKFKVAQMKKREALSQRDAPVQSDASSQPTVDIRPSPADLDGFDVDVGGFEDELDGPPPPPKPAPRPAAPAPRPAPAAATPRPAAAAAGDLGGLSESRLQQLHKVYVDAKRRTGEQSSLTLEALRAQVAKQVPVIRQKHGCAQVDFKVVLKDGKAMLKAIPK
ncbi:MAG: hypothetical protein FJ137_08345 [Deltaproteobacteria bacterium]|nr:hypothetical protein [Deltaproteobacteria bacterium]